MVDLRHASSGPTPVRNSRMRPIGTIHFVKNADKIWMFNERGQIIIAKLSPKGYQEISRAALVEPTYPFAGCKVAWTPPAFANRQVFARTDKELICASLAAKP